MSNNAVMEAMDALNSAFSLPFAAEPNGLYVVVAFVLLVMISPMFTALATGQARELGWVMANSALRCLLALVPIAGAVAAVVWVIVDNYRLIARFARKQSAKP